MQSGIKLGQELPLHYGGVFLIVIGIFLILFQMSKVNWYQKNAVFSIFSMFISVGMIFIIFGIEIVPFSLIWLIVSVIIAFLLHSMIALILAGKARKHYTFEERLKSDEAIKKLKVGCISFIVIIGISLILILLVR